MPPAEVLDTGLLIAVAVVSVAGIMRGFAGFGGTMVIAPVLSLLFDTPEAVAISLLLNTLVSVQLLPDALPLTRWKEIAPMSVATVLTPPLGAMILIAVDADIMRRVIALIVMVFTAVLASGWRFKGQPSTALNFATGAVSGIVTGAAGTGGPPIILYIFASDRPVAEKRANIISVFAVLLVATVAALWFQDVITAHTLWRTALLAPFFFFSAWIGQRTFRKVGDVLYQRVAFGFLFAVSAVVLVV
jgi:uncharacterized protein